MQCGGAFNAFLRQFVGTAMLAGCVLSLLAVCGLSDQRTDILSKRSVSKLVNIYGFSCQTTTGRSFQAVFV
jgi:glycerol uptake facilitator-like aquaporin